MSLFILIPLCVIAVVGLLCLNVKAGFIVGDATENSGFDAGFYLMTVVGLTAIEASFVLWILGA